jgi:hypothetical protein
MECKKKPISKGKEPHTFTKENYKQLIDFLLRKERRIRNDETYIS